MNSARGKFAENGIGAVACAELGHAQPGCLTIAAATTSSIMGNGFRNLRATSTSIEPEPRWFLG